MHCKPLHLQALANPVLGPDFCCFFKWVWQSKGTLIMPCFLAIYTFETLPTCRWHGMQVEVMVYHICFANPHCRYGKRQALERPVLGNLSKGREAGYKDSPTITDSWCMSGGLAFTLIVTNITVIPSWSIVISVSLRRLSAMVLSTV